MPCGVMRFVHVYRQKMMKDDRFSVHRAGFEQITTGNLLALCAINDIWDTMASKRGARLGSMK